MYTGMVFVKSMFDGTLVHCIMLDIGVLSIPCFITTTNKEDCLQTLNSTYWVKNTKQYVLG